MKLKYKLLTPSAKPPIFATEGAACFDLYATEAHPPSGNSRTYGTGIAFDIPDGYHIKVYSRSGHGFNANLRLCNSTGIVDADFRGEVMVKLTYDGPDHIRPDWPWPGDRIAQAMLCRNVKTELVETGELTTTERGDKGFGSTGVK